MKHKIRHMTEVKAKSGSMRSIGAGCGPCRRWRKWYLPGSVTIVCLMALSTLSAYPPAPYHLLYGMVRDEYGTPLNTAGSTVIFETTAGTSVSSEIIPDIEADANFRIEVPMDSGLRAGLYNATAMQPMVPFRLKVRVGTTVYLPLEMNGDLVKLGEPGKRTRLNLTLGEDADGDGMPDAWERLIDQDISLVNADDDSDGDGLSNRDEYIAGTYAFDSKDGFRLDILDVAKNGRLLAFLAINGRTYSLEISTNLKDWQPMSFQVMEEGPNAPMRDMYKAYDIRRVELKIPADPTPAYYRLTVQ